MVTVRFKMCIRDRFQTIQEVIGRINIGKWIDFHRQRRDAYDPIALLTILLFAYARYGYASLRQLEEMSRYDLRCRWLLQGQTPSYKTYQRFINDQLKGTLEEIKMCIRDRIHTAVVFFLGSGSLIARHPQLSFLVDLTIMGAAAILIYGTLFKKMKYQILYVLLAGTVMSTFFSSMQTSSV